MRVLLLISFLYSTHALGQPAPEPVFRCNLGTKSADVVHANGALVYRYGRGAASPDLEVRSNGKDGRAYYGETPAQRELFKQLRFVNGEYSYILYEWRGGSGLAVTKGSTDISDRKCVGKGNGFADNAFTGSLNSRISQDQDDAITIR